MSGGTIYRKPLVNFDEYEGGDDMG